MTPEEVGQRLVALLAPVEATATVSGGQVHARATVDVPPHAWRAALLAARDDTELACDYFDWLSAVDELADGFDVVAHLWSTAHRHGVLLRARVSRDTPTVDSVVAVYPGAAWHERETHEMFGIDFAGHAGLLPLLLPPEFEGHPLRKEFVLASRVAKPWPARRSRVSRRPAVDAARSDPRACPRQVSGESCRPPPVPVGWGRAHAAARGPRTLGRRLTGGAGGPRRPTAGDPPASEGGPAPDDGGGA